MVEIVALFQANVSFLNYTSAVKKVFIPALALLSVFLSSFIALEQAPAVKASALEDRVEQRRLERSGATLRQTVQRSSSSSTGLSVEKRVERRLQERLNAIRQESPALYKTIVEMLQRRESRKQERLTNEPLPVKIEVANGVNMERAKRGIPALRYHPSLERSAQAHADDMIARNYFSHENPEGERSGDRIKKTGYGDMNAQECRCSYRVSLGENIAKGQTSVAQVIREWMESPSHREAMLSKEYQEIGVGIAGDVWVLNFGSVEINPAN